VLAIDVPGLGVLALEHLVLDFNGTLAVDGQLLAGVGDRLAAVAARLSIHMLTADTHGTAERALAGLPGALCVVGQQDQAEAKLRFVESLGTARVAAIGNGRNDRLMLAAVRLGIAVVQREGAAAEAIAAADVVVPAIEDALDLLLRPLRLVATLRS